MKRIKIMTDIVAPYWTVVMQYEVEDLGEFAKEIRGGTLQPEMENIMKGYKVIWIWSMADTERFF